MDYKTIKKSLNDKFDGISHKWIRFELEDEVFIKVKNQLKILFENEKISNKDLKILLKHFKRNDFFWLKYYGTKGTKDIICKCQIINENNEKFDIDLNYLDVLEADLLDGTPKSLKLFKVNKKSLGADVDWDKPDDGISDDLYPPIEEEMTQLGYELYKMTILEKEGKLQEYIDSFY